MNIKRKTGIFVVFLGFIMLIIEILLTIRTGWLAVGAVSAILTIIGLCLIKLGYEENTDGVKRIKLHPLLSIRRKIGVILLIVGLIFTIVGALYAGILNWSSSMYGWVLIIYAGVFLMILGLLVLAFSRKRKKTTKKVEISRKIVEFLKTDNSGITQLGLASELQIDHTKIKKSIDHLERLGVIEKKETSVGETLFFYREDLGNV
ncbi:MAG: hypothetical protein ACW98X_07350 [Promethearchaeota archaeon]|jgi:predicted transcriptional regulator